MKEKFLLIFVVFIAGIFNAVTGIGGGIIITPAFIYLGMDTKRAIISSLTLITLISLASTIQYSNLLIKILNFKILTLIIFGIFGSILSMKIFKKIKNNNIYLIISIYFITASILIILRNKLNLDINTYTIMAIIGFTTATSSMMIGVGGGGILASLLLLLTRIEIKEIVLISITYIFITSFTCFIINLKTNKIEKNILIYIPSIILGLLIGKFIYLSINPLFIKIFLLIILIVNSALMLNLWLKSKKVLI